MSTPHRPGAGAVIGSGVTRSLVHGRNPIDCAQAARADQARPKRSIARSASIRPIAGAAVAAGDGALRTWMR
jgi:hypothetical protein